jgi:hypothetical protein
VNRITPYRFSSHFLLCFALLGGCNAELSKDVKKTGNNNWATEEILVQLQEIKTDLAELKKQQAEMKALLEKGAVRAGAPAAKVVG